MTHSELRGNVFPSDLGPDALVQQPKRIQRRVHEREKLVLLELFLQVLHEEAEHLYAVHVKIIVAPEVLRGNLLHRPLHSFFLA